MSVGPKNISIQSKPKEIRVGNESLRENPEHYYFITPEIIDVEEVVLKAPSIESESSLAGCAYILAWLILWIICMLFLLN